MRERWALRMAVLAALLPGALGLVSACGGDSKSGGEEDTGGPTAADGSGGSSASGGSGGSSASSDSGGSSASGGSGGSSASSDSGGSSASGGPNDLSGTWDLIVSEPDGDASTSTVTLSPTQLAVAGKLELLALVANNIVDIAHDGEAVRATREAVDMDLGVIPLPLAGLMHFTGVPDDGPSCDYALDSDALTLVCTDDISAPSDLPDLDNADLQAVHTEPLNSDFGELGGRWSVTAEDVDCSVVFEGNTIAAVCSQAGSDSGTVSITVDSDRVSGSTSEGLEFTAQRR